MRIHAYPEQQPCYDIISDMTMGTRDIEERQKTVVYAVYVLYTVGTVFCIFVILACAITGYSSVFNAGTDYTSAFFYLVDPIRIQESLVQIRNTASFYLIVYAVHVYTFLYFFPF